MPLGQQPSPVPSMLGFFLVFTHTRWQAGPVTVSVVHLSLSSQSAMVLHLPAPLLMPGSHFSLASRMPLPQLAGQSLSVLKLAPGGQQPSPLLGWVTAFQAHSTSQSLPLRYGFMHFL